MVENEAEATAGRYKGSIPVHIKSHITLTATCASNLPGIRMLDEIIFLVSVSEDVDDETGELVEAFEGVECVDFMDFENCLSLFGLCLSFSVFLLNLLNLFSRCL